MNISIQLITAIIIGLGAGRIGAYLVLRRMALVGDALSHVALPGIAVALIYHFNPFMGALTALFLAIIGIWAVEKRTHLPSEALVGIFFTTALAVGILLTPEPELLEALFGDISQVNIYDGVLAALIILILIIIISRIHKSLILSTISSELTQSMGIRVNLINFIFLALVSVVVALGLKIAGTLLMGSLVIIPAATARNISRSMTSYIFVSTILGGLASFFGILTATRFNLAPGALVVLAGGLMFLLSLLFKNS